MMGGGEFSNDHPRKSRRPPWTNSFHESEPTANTAGANVASRPAERLTAIAGVLGAIAASSCCVLPLLFVTLGVSGAWIGNLTALAPYQPYILALTVAALGYGFYSVYWRPRQVCSEGTCERPLSSHTVKLGLWLGTILVAVALIFPRIALVLAGY